MAEWKNVAITDEMSIEVGGTFGLSYVWRDKTERWHKDCVCYLLFLYRYMWPEGPWQRLAAAFSGSSGLF